MKCVPGKARNKSENPATAAIVGRAQGCLLGQLSGDALGSLVEFLSPEEIALRNPGGVRDMAAGGTWGTLPGQPTEDSEMALVLARSIAGRSRYDGDNVHAAYQRWWDSEPFDYGRSITLAMLNMPDAESQANGAIMRVSPLGIFGSRFSLAQTARWAAQDAALTHPSPTCRQANSLFAMAIAYAVKEGPEPEALYRELLGWMEKMPVEAKLEAAVRQAESLPPDCYGEPVASWVLIALHNALYRLLHAESFEEGVVATIMEGGDTDTNAAVCGALLGAVHGIGAVPERWRETVLSCKPEEGGAGVARPRPPELWPADALRLAERLAIAESRRSRREAEE